MTENSLRRAGTYLGFDFGLKRIGVAVGDTVLGTAQPLLVVANTHGTPDWSAIDAAIKQWQPIGLVVGVPLTEDGAEQSMTHHARGFLKRIKQRSGLPSFAADERFTSISAQHALREMRQRGQRGTTQKSDVDKLAAALILQAWFSDTVS